MGKGELVEQVRFPPTVRHELGKILAGYDVAAIIPQLEDLATIETMMPTAPGGKGLRLRRWRREKLRAAVRQVLQGLDRDNDDDLITLELCRREKDPREFLRALREGLIGLDKTLTGLLPTLPKRKGGRKSDPLARWLVDETESILRRAGVPITDDEDGTRAKTLRVLWPVVLHRDWPTELRHWFKPATARRK